MDGSGIFKTRDAPITRWQPRQARATTTRLAWICLAAGLTLLLLMQVWAGLSLRGLYADGSYYAARLWLTQSFVVVEPARRTSQMLMQLPVVAAMTLGSPSPLTVARLFSLSTNIMPLCCTLLGFALLPRAMRAYALIPLTVYLCAGMAAAIASVADAPFAAAYLWLLMLLIAVAPLTAGRLAAMLLLGLGALHLHEATGLLGPILILACIMRTREAKLPWQRTGLALTAVLVGIGTSHAVMDMLHPRLVAHRDSFLHDLTSLRWLWSVGGGLNLPAADGVLGLLAFAVLAGAGRQRRLVLAAGTTGAVLLAMFAVTAPGAAAPSAFAARGLSSLVSAPAMMLLLARKGGWRVPAMPQRETIALTAALGMSLTVMDGAANRAWLGYVSALREVLASRPGVIPWNAAMGEIPAPEARALQSFRWPWTTPLISLWLTPAGEPIRSLISNAPGVSWEPASPAIQNALLAKDPPPDLGTALGALAPRTD